jgi:nitrate reductase delta subunit
MTGEERSLLKLVSLLLQYPEATEPDSLASLEGALSEISNPEARAVCSDFLNRLRTTPLLRLQETYSATFDLNPSTSLELGYHRWGDGKERGGALAHLVGLYAKAGYEVATGELPDYLPLILEFLSLCPEEMELEIINEYGSQVAMLASRLAEDGSPYAALLRMVSESFANRSAKPAGA